MGGIGPFEMHPGPANGGFAGVRATPLRGISFWAMQYPSEAQMLLRATLLLLAVPLSAHNGAVAIAMPVS